MCWHLYAFPWSVSAESECVDLSVLKFRSFCSEVCRYDGFECLVHRLVPGQHVGVIACECSNIGVDCSVKVLEIDFIRSII